MQDALHSLAIAEDPNEVPAALGATSAAIVNGFLYIAQIAPTQMYILRDGTIHALPNDGGPTTHDEFDLDIGQEVDLFRAALQAGDCLLLASTDLRHELTEREMRGMLLKRVAQEAAHDMCALVAQRGGQRCEVVVVHVERTESPPTTAARDPVRQTSSAARDEPISSADQAPDHLSRPHVPRNHPDHYDSRTAPLTAGRNQSLARRIATLPVAILTLVVVLPVVAARAIGSMVTGGKRRTHSEPAPVKPDIPETDVDDDWSSLRNLRASKRSATQTKDIPPQPTRPLEYVGTNRSGGRDPLLTRRRRSAPGPGTLLFVLSLVLLVVMATALVLRNSGEPPSPEDPSTTPGSDVTNGDGPVPPPPETATDCFNMAQRLYQDAIDKESSETKTAVLLQLRRAADHANDCRSADGGQSISQDIRRLLEDITKDEERIDEVVKLVPSATIDEFDSEGIGNPIRALDVRLDTKYVLDAVDGRVLSYATARQGVSALRSGDVVASVTVADPLAVVDRSLSTIVVDSNYNIFSIEEEQEPRLLRITGIDQWQNPVAYDNFNNNLYVLDPAANYIFKYQWTAGGYELGPTGYLDPREDIDVSRAIDFAIDGDIFILFADSTVRRFSGGSEVDFTITGLEGDSPRYTLIFTDVDCDNLYLADPEKGRIVQIDKRGESAGTFVRQFKYAGSDDFFSDIRGLWVSEIDMRMIVLGKDKLRQFVLPRATDRTTTP